MTGLVDLHIHTDASDGTMTAQALMNEIKEKSVTLFSVTDHDTIDKIEEMTRLANQNNVDFIPGVEISVTFGKVELHILTYGINIEDERLLEILRYNQAIREAHNLAVVKFAHDKQPNFDIEAYESYVSNPKRGGWKAVNFLIDKGVVKSISDFFALVEEMGVPLTFDPYDQMIPKLKALGYTLVLAHPPAYFKGEVLDVAFLDELVELGIQGIECYSPYYSSSDERQYYLEYCRRKELLITSGSDYHGTFIRTRHLAYPDTTTNQVSYTQLMKHVKK